MAYSRNTNKQGGDSNGTQRSVNAGVHPCRIKPENLDPFNPLFNPLPCEDGSLVSDPRFGSWCSDFHNWNDPLIIVNNDGPSMGGEYQNDTGCGYDGRGACCVDGENCASGCDSTGVLGGCCIDGACSDDYTASMCAAAQGSFSPGWSCIPVLGEDPACHLLVENGGFCDTEDPRCVCVPGAWSTGRGSINCETGACCSSLPICNPGGDFGGTCCLNYECIPQFEEGPGACCTGVSSCVVVDNKSECDNVNGEYLGKGRTCESTDDEPLSCSAKYNTCVTGVPSAGECEELAQYFKDVLGAGENCASSHSTGGFSCCEEGDCCYRGEGGCPTWVDCGGIGDGQSYEDDEPTCCCVETKTSPQGSGADPCRTGSVSTTYCISSTHGECKGESADGNTCTTRTPTDSCGECCKDAQNVGCSDCDGPDGGQPRNTIVGSACCQDSIQSDCPFGSYWQGPGTSCTDTDGIPGEACGFKTCRNNDTGECIGTHAYSCFISGVTEQGDWWDPGANGFWERGIPAGCDSTRAGDSDQYGCCVYTTQQECLAPYGDNGFGGTQWLPGVDCVVFGDQDRGDCGFTSSCPSSSN